MTAADWFPVFLVLVAFMAFIGAICLMVHLRYNGPWWCRVLFWLPVLILNIICLLANWDTLERAFDRSNSR